MENLLDFEVPETLDLLKIAIEQIQDWVVITDINGLILYNNSQVEKLSGYSKKEIIGKKPSIWKSNLSSPSTYKTLWDTILGGKAFYGVIANRHKDGSIFYLANTISPVKNNKGEIEYFVSTAKGITQNYKLKKQIYNFTYYDPLTQLPNRNSFLEKIQVQLKENNNKLAVMAINIGKMDLINTTYGFVLGDQFIKEIGKRIKNQLEEKYSFARIESDTFGILVGDVKKLSKLISLIRKIEKSMEQPIIIENKQLYAELSIGVVIYPEDIKDNVEEIQPNELLTRAQTALLKIKRDNSLQTYAFYTTEMNEEVARQLKLESEIYKAYENDEFIPYFQPQIDLKDNKIYALESLMRRKSSKGEIILPSQFIDVLEQLGLIDKVEMQLIRKICIQIKEWLDQGIKVVPVAINISPLQLRNKNLTKEIMRIIREVDIPCQLITLEITESLFVEDMELAKSIVEELRKEGLLIAIDDFGTGYSALSYLKELKVDHLKIDISFIRDIVKNRDDKAIVKAIISIAKALGMETIAEGIETREQLELIRRLGCDIGQGLYWACPLQAEEIVDKYLS